jgi:hypoxanthine phosphoribosyltransferase
MEQQQCNTPGHLWVSWDEYHRAMAGTLRGELTISASLSSTAGPLAGNILLVDDLVDSGITLKKVQEHIAANFPLVTELRTAVIWVKACSVMKPDYYLDYLADSPWIHQPFEIYDDMTPDLLK